MFDFVRSHNRILQIALGLLIIPAFGIFGVQSYTSMNSEQSQAVASVDGRDVTRAEWEAQHRHDVEVMRQRSPDMDPKLLDSPAAQRASLDTLVRERVVQAAIKREGLTPSNERILREYQTNEEYARYRAMPKQARDAMGAQLYQSISQDMAARQALQGVALTGFVPASSLKASLDSFFDTRDIQWQRFDTKDYAAAIQPTDAQVDAYYRAHTAQFVAPEQARIDYLVLDALNLQPQAKVLPEEVRQYYDQHLKDFTSPEERSASYILTKVAPNAAPADVAKAKAQADSQLAELRKNPAAFADAVKKIAAEPGGPLDAGDLDFMRKGALGQPALDDALFAMKEGGISDVIRIDAGFQIVKLTGVRGGAVKPFDEVKAQIEDQLKLAAAQKLFQADAEGFTNAVYENPDSLDKAAATYKLSKQTATVQRQAGPGAAGPMAAPKLLAAVFSTDSIKARHNTEAVETAPGQLVSAHVVEYTPQHTRPLAEVHDQVVQAVRQELAAAAARKDGEARVAAAKADPALALPLTATATRNDRTGALPMPVVVAALKADLSKGPAVVGVALPDGGYAAIRVLNSAPKVPEQGVKEAFTNAFEEAEAQAVYDSLKARYKVKYEEDRIARVTAQPASAPN
jgi:peptidyl-prolyl cis-trans isomerase D